MLPLLETPDDEEADDWQLLQEKEVLFVISSCPEECDREEVSKKREPHRSVKEHFQSQRASCSCFFFFFFFSFSFSFFAVNGGSDEGWFRPSQQKTKQREKSVVVKDRHLNDPKCPSQVAFLSKVIDTRFLPKVNDKIVIL